MSRASAEPWKAPPEFDGFRVIRPLGQGGMGTVLRADDVVLDRPVALKFLLDEGEPRARERFLMEARALARLQHPNVVQVFRVGEVDRRAYIAYELIEGTTLQGLAKPVDWGFALELGIGMARGLAAVHARGLLHRDLKPANVVLTARGEPKLIDFGLARSIDDDERVTPTWADDPTAPAGLTSIGRIVGTPQYMAPELFLGEAATVRSDVYALALILRELLTGESLRAGLRLGEMATQVLERDAPKAHARNAPSAMLELVDGCLRRDPALRCRSAEELLDSLELVRGYYRPFAEPTSTSAETDAQISLVTGSFARLAPSGERLVSRFYEIVFTLDARLRELFPAEMTHQRKKVMHAIETVVAQLRSPERLVPMLEALGRRHARYGVKRDQLDVTERAMLAAVRELDPEWTPEIERAWSTAITRLHETLRRGLDLSEGERADTIAPTRSIATKLSPPATRYVDRDGVAIAFQVLGEGATDILLVPGLVTHLELAWQHPAILGALAGIADLGRLIVLDKRGTGLSERVATRLSLEEHAADALAVLDAAESERAIVLGVGDGAAIALSLAALHPERVKGLVLHAPIAIPDLDRQARREGWIAELRARWGGPVLLDTVAPSLRDDASFREVWASTLRTGSSPGAATALLQRSGEIDLRALLAFVHAPTTIVHRKGDRFVPVASGRALAERMAGARWVELPGDDHYPPAGELSPWLAVLGAAVRDARPLAPPRPLAVGIAIEGEEGAAAVARAVLRAQAGLVERDGWISLASPLRAVEAARRASAAARAACGVAPSIALVAIDRVPEHDRRASETARAALEGVGEAIIVLDPIGELVRDAGLDLEAIAPCADGTRRLRVRR